MTETITFANGVVVEERQHAVRRQYGRKNQYGYFYVNRVVVNPFKKGDKVRIGNGKEIWTVDLAGGNAVGLKVTRKDPKHFMGERTIYRDFEYAGLARVNFA